MNMIQKLENDIAVTSRYIARMKAKNVFANVSKLRQTLLAMETEYFNLLNSQFHQVAG